MKTYTFIDASNIIYGTKDEGWRVDFRKLYSYLKKRYESEIVYYFAGVEKNNTKQGKFYELLARIGYDLVLKPVKIYSQLDGKKVRKANCDVDLTFYAMKELTKFKRAIFFTGDGDFEILIKYFLEKGKTVLIFANASRAARELKILKEIQFNDLRVLRGTIEFEAKK